MLAPAANSPIFARPVAPLRPGAPCEGPFGMIGTPMRFARNAEIFGEDEPAEYLYQVISGAVRTYRMLDDGRRQISAFYLAGDVFGFEAGDTHLSTAEAIGEAQILIVRRSNVLARAERENSLAKRLWMLTARELQRAQQHSLVLIKNADERVAGFLLEMARRNASQAAVELPMSRQDIADYLGLTIETVSRTITQFVQSRIIALETSRRIRFCDRAALNRLDA
jgi:CRP/FNR family nitrogen fixation transcriptional regulator